MINFWKEEREREKSHQQTQAHFTAQMWGAEASANEFFSCEISENLECLYTQTSKLFYLQSNMKKSLKKHFQVEMANGLQMQRETN